MATYFISPDYEIFHQAANLNEDSIVSFVPFLCSRINVWVEKTKSIEFTLSVHCHHYIIFYKCKITKLDQVLRTGPSNDHMVSEVK